jgi:uncharacterized protein (TIGR02001 family)
MMSLGVVSNANAEDMAASPISADLTIASNYLWRGVAINGFSPVLQSNVQYDHDSGLYIGTWFSNEGALSNSSEVDLFGGYGGSAGDISYGVGIAGYYYPEAAGAPTSTDLYEVILSGGYKDYGITAYVNVEPDNNDDYKYFSIDGPLGPVSLHAGMTMTDSDAGKYMDFSVSYNFTENLAWTVSYATGDAIAEDGPSDDPIVVVSYSVPLK